jgi:hypothetical protein
VASQVQFNRLIEREHVSVLTRVPEHLVVPTDWVMP